MGGNMHKVLGVLIALVFSFLPVEAAQKNKALPFTEMVAWLNHGAPLYTRELNRDFHTVQSAPFNAYSIQTLGGNCASRGAVPFQSTNGITKCLAPGSVGSVITAAGGGADIAWEPAGTAGSIAIGATAITGGTNGYVLSNNAGALGNIQATANATASTIVQRDASADAKFVTLFVSSIAIGADDGLIYDATGTGSVEIRTGVGGTDNFNQFMPTGGLDISSSAGGVAFSVAGTTVISSGRAGVFTNITYSGSFTGVANTIAGADLTNASVTATQIATNTVANSNLTNSPAATIKGNPTSSSAAPSDFTVQGLTDISTPNVTLDLLPIYNHTTGTLEKTNASELLAAVGSGVTSWAGKTGAVTPLTSDLTTTTSGSSPAAGKLGEVMSVSVAEGTPVNLTTTVSAQVMTLNLTAGHWECTGNVGFSANGSTTIVYRQGAISLTSALVNFTNSGAFADDHSEAAGLTDGYYATGSAFFDLSTTTAIYLNARASFAISSLAAFGTFNCQRTA